MEAVTVVIESPVKYDIPYSADMHGQIDNKPKNRKTKTEKIIDKISKSIGERE